jgi:hypothetical protein
VNARELLLSELPSHCFFCGWLRLQKFDTSTAREMAGFDNVGYSMISVFQSMTLSNWSFTMYRTMDFLSPAVVIYWLAMIIFGAYFVVSNVLQTFLLQ